MPCGCSGTMKRVGPAHGTPPRRAWFSGRDAGSAREKPCCEACGLGLACGADVAGALEVEVEARVKAALRLEGRGHYADARNPLLAARERAMVIASREAPDDDDDDERDAGDGEDGAECPRLRNESVAAYRARCGLDPLGMSAELWRSMNAGERRVYLQAVAREARMTQQQEQQLISRTITGGFDILRQGITAIRDVRIEEIHADRDVQIARIRFGATGELDYLGWSSGDANPRTTTPPQASSSGGASTVATVGVVYLLARALGGV